jgi:hypothetical protein
MTKRLPRPPVKTVRVTKIAHPTSVNVVLSYNPAQARAFIAALERAIQHTPRGSAITVGVSALTILHHES